MKIKVEDQARKCGKIIHFRAPFIRRWQFGLLAIKLATKQDHPSLFEGRID